MLPTSAQVLGFFNLLVGLMIVLSILLFLGGFIMYLIRLGTWPTYRDEAVKIMQWGVSTLFTVIVLLAVQQFLVVHLLVATSLAAAAILAFIAWAVIQAGSATPQEPTARAPRG